MITTQETNQSVTIPATSQTRTDNVDPDAFASELGSRMGGTTQDKISQTLEKLASSFPGATVSTRQIAGVTSNSVEAGGSLSINISSEMAARMAEDGDLFDRVKQMVSSLVTAGNEQKLVETGGSDIRRSVNIQDGEVRYVEVQRGPNGSQLSVSSLALETQKVIDDAIEQMFAGRNGGSSGKTSSQNRGFGFQNLVGNSTSWRLESFISSQAFTGLSGQNIGSNGIQRLTSSSRMVSLEVIIQQWSVASQSGNVSGTDLITYIQEMGLCDPLVFDLADEGINLRSADDGVYFDIKGDGSPVQTAFIQGNNAFLYLDRNGNGVVDDVSELFGDHGGFANGFENLSQYDDNGDGIIDERDAIYSQLRLWRDLNGDGVNQIEESLTLAEAGIKSINLGYDNKQQLDEHGNVIGERSTFTRQDGSTGTVADVWLKNNG